VAGPLGFSASLGNNPTYKIGLSGDYAITRQWHVSLGAEYTYFKYGETDVVPLPIGFAVWEPNSSSKVTTVKVGLGYAF
jgi:opacity protein-like surface antigen